MKISRAVLVALPLLLLLSACKTDMLPQGREIENMSLMRTLGVDGRAGGVSVTASSGVQSKGVGEEAEPPLVFSGTAGTISAACLALQSQGNTHIFYGHVSQLLLGEEQAAADVTEALEYVERDVEMRLDTELFVVKGGTAGAVIAAAATEDAAVVDRLEALEQDAADMADTMPRTVKNVLTGLAQNGASFAPAIAVMGEKQELAPAGYAIFKEKALAGWAEGDAARGINLILGQTDADVLELTLPAGETVALRLVGVKTKVHPVFQAGELSALELNCTVEANVAQAPDTLALAEGDAVARLRAALAAVVGQRVRQAADLAQALNADFMGLGKRAGMAAPWHWAAIQEQWGDKFSALPIHVRVDASIQRGYDIKG